LNSAGYIILFWQIQQDIKREMLYKISQILPSEKLTCIKFLKKDISQSEWNDKTELEYKGAMFDVVKKVETSKYYLFYCLNDEKEDLLIKNYNGHFDDNKDKTAHNNARFFFSLIAAAILQNNIIIKYTNAISSIQYLSFHYRSVWQDQLTPPPRQLV
jgi:hypothetical protein